MSEETKFLMEISERGFNTISKHTPLEKQQAYRNLLNRGLIYDTPRGSIKLTEKGQEAVDLGSFEEWKFRKDQETTNKEVINQLTIKQLKGSIFHLKYWWVILLLNIVLSGIVGFVSGNWKLVEKLFK